MRTLWWRVDPVHPDPDVLARAGQVLRDGGLVAFPTETVYGLGAHALDPAAVRRIFAAKGRPSDNPLIVHVADREGLDGLVRELPETGRRLMDRFWPGPLTLVLPKGPTVPPEVTAGLDTVAVRMPDHQVAQGLIMAAGVPVAAPSANRSGRPSPTMAKHVWEDLEGRIELILDGGPAGVGVESTVVDVTGPVPVLLRPGGVAWEELERVAGPVRLDPALAGQEAARPRAPGMKYVHYAPRAPLTLVVPRPETSVATVGEVAWRLAAEQLTLRPGTSVGLLILAENLEQHEAAAAAAGVPFRLGELTEPSCGGGPGEVLALAAGPVGDPGQLASRLFAALRWFDASPVSAIVAEGVHPVGLGLAVMNRLRKAAQRIVEA